MTTLTTSAPAAPSETETAAALELRRLIADLLAESPRGMDGALRRLEVAKAAGKQPSVAIALGEGGAQSGSQREPYALTLDISREDFDKLLRRLNRASCIVGAVRGTLHDEAYTGGALHEALDMLTDIASEFDAVLPAKAREGATGEFHLEEQQS